MFDETKIGRRIKELRGNQTQDACARALGISRGALSFYENGERKPDAETLYRMCRLFSVSADYLLGLSDVKSVDKDMQTACTVTGLPESAIKQIRAFSDSEKDYLEACIDFFDSPTSGAIENSTAALEECKNMALQWLFEDETLKKMLSGLLVIEASVIAEYTAPDVDIQSPYFFDKKCMSPQLRTAILDMYDFATDFANRICKRVHETRQNCEQEAPKHGEHHTQT